MNRDEALAAVKSAGLSRVANDLKNLMAESIRLKTRTADEKAIAPGASKVGGHPDLPSGAMWPTWKGTPLSFVAQINLPEVRQYDAARVLPASGMLYFFYDAKQQVFGSDPADRGGWKVMHHGGDASSLSRAAAPSALPANAQFKACTVEFFTEITLPQRPSVYADSLKWTADEQKAYSDFMTKYPSPGDRTSIHNRLLGYPDEIQDDMHWQVQLASHGLKSDKDPKAAELKKGTLEWQLLLQVDSDENAGMRWGSTGMLYYWIQRQALQLGNFDNVWVVLQSE